MMKDVIQHGTAYASVWAAGFHLPAAAKTGTTNDYNDVWFIGYTADLVAGIWMGMDRPVKIMHDAQGGRLAGPAWTSFMTEVYRRKPTPPDWPRPDGLIAREIDRTTGMLRNPYCPASIIYTEWYIPGTEPVQECTVHSATDTAVGDTTHMEMPVSAGPPAPIAVTPPPPQTGAAIAAPTPATPAARPTGSPAASQPPPSARAAGPGAAAAAPAGAATGAAVGVRVPPAAPRPAGRP
jgi:penicillin-binding protein 1A